MGVKPIRRINEKCYFKYSHENCHALKKGCSISVRWVFNVA